MNYTAKPMIGGPQPVIREAVEAAFRRLLEDSAHPTLTECRDPLAAETGVRVYPWTVGRMVRRLGWT
jgi:transposase